jgi:hypothetical protein
MIRFQTHRTKLPIGSAAGRRGRINTAAFVASLALIAQMLSACSSLPQSFPATSAAAQYPDLNDPPQSARRVRTDQVAQIKAELIQLRDDEQHAAAQQAALH